MSICPKLYQSSDPARLPAGPLARAMAWQYGARGLILTGETGKGKTRIAWLLLRRVLIEDVKRLRFYWFDCVGFGHAIGQHYKDEDAEKWLEKLGTADLVFFDDLGKLKLTERAETELFGLVERRCANELPMIVTTNDTGDSLAARMTENRGPAMMRRLREFCDVIKL
jgi:DNA replication protein DnaC